MKEPLGAGLLYIWQHLISQILTIGKMQPDGSLVLPERLVGGWIARLRSSAAFASSPLMRETEQFLDTLTLDGMEEPMAGTSNVNPLDEPVVEPVDLFDELSALIDKFKASKPNDRSAQDRFWAIAITHLEDAQSTFFARIVIQDSVEKRARHA